MPDYTTANIPYLEMRAINDLLRLQPEAQKTGAIKALIVFGELVEPGGQSSDINLLEIVSTLSGPRHARFRDTPELSLRGELNLYLLTTDEFEHPSRVNLPDEQFSSADLLERVVRAYAILQEQP